MERTWTDAEAGRGSHRSRCTGKQALLILVQNLLVLGCLLLTLYNYLSPTMQEDVVCIQVQDFTVRTGSDKLQFGFVRRQHRMELDETKEKIHIKCTGLYIWYMDVHFINTTESKGSGSLQLQVEGRKNPVSSVSLNCAHNVCRGLHHIVYFRAKEVVTVHLEADGLASKNVTMGLTYLLGNKCDY